MIIDRAAGEGWLYTPSDIKALLSIDPNGSFMAEVEGIPRAFIIVIKMGEFAFTSMLYVDKECRTSKVAYQIYMRALEYCQECNRGCDIALDKLTKAKAIGFNYHCDVVSMTKRSETTNEPLPQDFVDLRSVPIGSVTAFDTEVYGYPRKGYTSILLEDRNNHGLAAMKDGKVVGMVILRQRTEGAYTMGPLYAEDKETAKQLVQHAQNLVPGKEIFMSIFKTQQEALEIYSGWSFYTTELRMYTDQQPKSDTSKIYAIFE